MHGHSLATSIQSSRSRYIASWPPPSPGWPSWAERLAGSDVYARRPISELRTAFHRELESIEGMMIQLFAFITEDLALATDALLSNNADTLNLVSERETVIDGLYHEIENLGDKLLVLQAPVVGDFRLVISMLRIVPELERSHDLVVHIAEHATHMLGDELSPRSRGLVQRMGETATEMWTQAAKAWGQRDPEAARALEERDDDMDSLHGALLAELASGKMSLPVAMDMTLVARFYERLGDHSVNVARRIAYVAGPSHRY
jgi:phosphate transport system protein